MEELTINQLILYDLQLEFPAFGRNFRLILHRRTGLLHPHFNAYAVDGKGVERRIDVGKFYASIASSIQSTHVSMPWMSAERCIDVGE